MSTWTNIDKLQGQSAVTYNSSAVTYNQATTQYNGKEQTVWTNVTKN